MEIKYFRNITRNTKIDHTINNKLRAKLKQEWIIQRIEKKQLEWFGNLKDYIEIDYRREYLKVKHVGKEKEEDQDARG